MKSIASADGGPVNTGYDERISLKQFTIRQAIEIPLFICLWQLIYLGAATLNNVLHTALGFFPPVLEAFVRTSASLTFAAAILVWSRVFVFEVLHRKTPYITQRHAAKRARFFSRDRVMVTAFLAVCGTPLFYYRPVFDLYLLSLSDHALLLALWLLTDLFFFLLHGAMHFRWLFRTFHYAHHQGVPRPNAYIDCDRFTYIDALTHFVEYIIAYNLLSLVVPLSNELWLVGIYQWLIIGQLQHGGKAIRQNQLPGLEIVRRLAGVGHSFCFQHDMHHLKVSANFSMTGIYDKWFGTKKIKSSHA